MSSFLVIRSFLKRGEVPALIVSFCYFFLLLSSYYILRPIRESQVAGLGVAEIKYLVLTVFVVMLAVTPLFGSLMTHVPRRRVLPALYAFFTLNLLLFAIAFALPDFAVWSARVFYVWVTVFNFFVVSVFWSFMADVWREEQGRRLFGFIAAGGSLGGLVGPQLARWLSASTGTTGMILVSALLLSGTVVCIIVLGRISDAQNHNDSHAHTTLSGSSLEGLRLVVRSPFLLGIAALLIIGVVVAQFAYAETARLAKEQIETPEARTAFYANIDFWVNVVTLISQALIVGLLTARFGIVAPLLGLAIVGCISFVALALSPLLSTLAFTNVMRRSAEYGLGKPGRDMLYTVATPQEKYLAKNVIDTVVARGGDMVGSWLYSVGSTLGMTLVGFGWWSAAAMLGAVFLAFAVARGYHRRGGK